MTRPTSCLLRAGLALALLLPTPSCATIVGTAASPITGGVDLCMVSLRPSQWYWTPFVFIGGAVAGPFVAVYNGLNYDAQVFKSFTEYWYDFHKVFQPYRMLGL